MSDSKIVTVGPYLEFPHKPDIDLFATSEAIDEFLTWQEFDGRDVWLSNRIDDGIPNRVPDDAGAGPITLREMSNDLIAFSVFYRDAIKKLRLAYGCSEMLQWGVVVYWT